MYGSSFELSLSLSLSFFLSNFLAFFSGSSMVHLPRKAAHFPEYRVWRLVAQTATSQLDLGVEYFGFPLDVNWSGGSSASPSATYGELQRALANAFDERHRVFQDSIQKSAFKNACMCRF